MWAVPPNPSDTEVIQVKPDTTIIAALASNPTALQAYLAACDTAIVEPDVDTTQAIPTRKGSNPRSSARAKATPKRTPAKATGKRTNKRTPKAAPEAWVVNPDWAGIPASPRMLAAALYWGIPTATCNKLKGDKLALSLEIARKRGIPVAQ